MKTHNAWKERSEQTNEESAFTLVPDETVARPIVLTLTARAEQTLEHGCETKPISRGILCMMCELMDAVWIAACQQVGLNAQQTGAGVTLPLTANASTTKRIRYRRICKYMAV
jgi:hypothetical protein